MSIKDGQNSALTLLYVQASNLDFDTKQLTFREIYFRFINSISVQYIWACNKMGAKVL